MTAADTRISEGQPPASAAPPVMRRGPSRLRRRENAAAYVLITPFVGAAIYAAFFATAGGLQFFLINGAEFTAAFVYGGSYAGQLPGSVLITPVRVLFTFVFPATVTAYLPALLIMGLEGPKFLPAWLGWFAPLFAVWAWLLAWLAWRAGMRRFTGAGG